ncbi:shikimate dehydrogenase [Tepidamorphus sp. 3E244]|uniref:shikimate dehydrogenase n=1 Tax=Tepidamorphus sp. 3E244 TaxID=3385498 RepID=UPI0038FBF14B
MTDRYALFGNPVSHSKSPQIHMAFADQTAQDISYEAIEVQPGELAAAVDAFRARAGLGFNLTVPLKLEGLELAEVHGRDAELAGATNCVKVVGGKLHAENFDGVGIVRDIEANLGRVVRGARVLMLGAGGAARGAILPIINAATAELLIANRTAQKAHELADAFSPFGKVSACGYDSFPKGDFDIVINATSSSLHGEVPPVPASAFAQGCLAYDMMYGKGLTPFLALARDSGATEIADGVGMLVEQAAEAFHWWRGVRPETKPVIDAITVPLT